MAKQIQPKGIINLNPYSKSNNLLSGTTNVGKPTHLHELSLLY